MIRLINKLEILPIIFGGLSGAFFTELGIRFLVTIVAMVVGTTASFYWRKYYLNKK